MQRVLAPLSGRRPADLWEHAGQIGVALAAGAFGGFVVGSALTGVSLSPLTWFLARASGFTLYMLLWFAVVSGLGMTTKLLRALGYDGEMWQIHRLATELSFVALALHLLSLAFDPTVALGSLGVLVPFVSDVRQPWTDLGIITGWGMVALAASFGLRRYIGQKGWRLLHYAAFPLWFTGLLHGIGAGTDSHAAWAAVLYAGTSGVVAYLSFYRALRWGRRGTHPTTHPVALRDRENMRRRVNAFRDQCASLSSKMKSNSPG